MPMTGSRRMTAAPDAKPRKAVRGAAALAALVTGTLALTGAAAGQSTLEAGTLPGYFGDPLAFLREGHVHFDNAYIDYLGLADNAAACDADPDFVRRVEGLGLVTAYYGLAEHLYLGGPLIEDNWDYAVYDDWSAIDEGRDWTTAGDLLKTVPTELREAWIDHAVEAVPPADRPRLMAAIDSYLAAYGPMATFAENDPERADRLIGDLYRGRIPLSLAGTGIPEFGTACDQNQVYLHLEIGTDETYVALPSVATVVRTFWLRRYTEGSHRLVHELLGHAHESLAALIASAPPAAKG